MKTNISEWKTSLINCIVIIGIVSVILLAAVPSVSALPAMKIEGALLPSITIDTSGNITHSFIRGNNTFTGGSLNIVSDTDYTISVRDISLLESESSRGKLSKYNITFSNPLSIKLGSGNFVTSSANETTIGSGTMYSGNQTLTFQQIVTSGDKVLPSGQYYSIDLLFSATQL